MTAHTPILLDGLRVVAVGLLGVLTAVVASREEGAVASAFTWLLASLTLWGGLTLLPPVANRLPVAADAGPAGGVFGLLTGGLVPILWFVYVRRYTGHHRDATRRRVGLLVLPLAVATVLSVAQVLTDGRPPDPVVWLYGAVFVLVYAYLAVLLVLGPYLLFRLTRRYKQVPATQVGVLAVGIVAPYIAVVASSLTQPTTSGGTVSLLPVDVSFVGFLVAGLAFPYAIRTYPLFTTFPDSEYVARDEVVEELSEGVVILDADNCILDLNEAAADLCPCSAGNAIGQPVQSVLDGFARLPTDGVRRVELRTPAGTRQFEISVSPLEDGGDGLLGKTLLLRDITTNRTREQQLAVLTRVLRHNLRNNVDAALAHTNAIADSETRTTVRSQLERITRMGNKARDIEQVLAKTDEPRTTVDAAAIVRSVADRFRSDQNECELVVTAPEELPIVAHRELLSRLLTELVENAIEHNDRSTPRVELTARIAEEDGEAVELEVADNGPGIPADEQRSLGDGVETQLEHGTGVGLWLASWIADAFGGTLAFSERQAGGSVVTVRLRQPPLFADGEDQP